MADHATTHDPALAGDYVIDPRHSRVSFAVRHMMVTWVRGVFTAFEGTAHIDPDVPSNSRVDVVIDVTSIDTGVADRDRHLRTGDFFDAERFPTISFTSTSVERDNDDWSITGDLAIRGVTRQVTVPFEFGGQALDPQGNVRAGFEGAATINRTDWGLSYNATLETGGVLISDKVKLALDISAIRAMH